MDCIDIEIVKMLEINGRISHEEIAKKLHMSRPAIHKRIEKLEDEKVITGYRALVDWRKVVPCIYCLIFLKINGCNYDLISNKVLSIDIKGIVVEECIRITGEWCVLVRARITTPEDTTKILDYLWQTEGIIETSTSFVVSCIL